MVTLGVVTTSSIGYVVVADYPAFDA